MAQAKRTPTADREPGGNVELLGQAEIKDGAEAGPTPMGTFVSYDQTMAEITMARRLYDVWQTVGGLTDPKWDWERQSGKSHDAWLAVARAASPAVLAKHWKPSSVADLLHG